MDSRPVRTSPRGRDVDGSSGTLSEVLKRRNGQITLSKRAELSAIRRFLAVDSRHGDRSDMFSRNLSIVTDFTKACPVRAEFQTPPEPDYRFDLAARAFSAA